MPAICSRPRCGKPTWNGKPGEYCSRSCRKMAMGGAPAPFSAGPRCNPQCNEILMDDPRHSGRQIGVISFYYPGHEEPCDVVCQAGFLGNFYEFPGGLSLKGLTFTNSEAAFQALKYLKSNLASQFQNISGDEAFRKKTALGNPDFTYGGFGSNWNAMQNVLYAKFRNPKCADLLRKTGDTFLLEHNSVSGRDNIWSDNHDGTGTNWLGLQLMLIRDMLNNSQNWKTLGSYIDLNSGKPVNEKGRQVWQDMVLNANRATMQKLSPVKATRFPSPSQTSNHGDQSGFCGWHHELRVTVASASELQKPTYKFGDYTTRIFDGHGSRLRSVYAQLQLGDCVLETDSAENLDGKDEVSFSGKNNLLSFTYSGEQELKVRLKDHRDIQSIIGGDPKIGTASLHLGKHLNDGSSRQEELFIKRDGVVKGKVMLSYQLLPMTRIQSKS